MRLGYREDIDWLRAIAVLSVVAFHFETPGVYGGFVGVDIFFVISGYLITGIIQAEVKEGAFSFARFYERRVRRLLPALYAMVALAAIPSFHYLLTSKRAEFFRSVAAVVTFTSNFLFWLQSGYFDHAAVEKPLLHTWSLAVEEQFYLALPVLLWGLLRAAPKKPAYAAADARGTDGGLVRPERRADAHRPLRERLLHESAAGVGVFDRRPGRASRRPRAGRHADATWRAGHRAGHDGDPDPVAAGGAGISRSQRAAALHRRRPLHLERDRRADETAAVVFVSPRRQVLWADLLFAISVALAALHLRAVREGKPRPRCGRPDRAVCGDGCDLGAVLVVHRAAISRPHPGAVTTRSICARRRKLRRAECGRRHRRALKRRIIGDGSGRGPARCLQFLRLWADLSRRQLL